MEVLLTGWLSNFVIQHPWVPMAIAVYLVVAKAIVGIRDSIDKSPDTDDNAWERIATVIGKTIGYMSGIRPQAPKGSTIVVGDAKQAVGTEVK